MHADVGCYHVEYVAIFSELLTAEQDISNVMRAPDFALFQLRMLPRIHRSLCVYLNEVFDRLQVMLFQHELYCDVAALIHASIDVACRSTAEPGSDDDLVLIDIGPSIRRPRDGSAG